MSRTCQHCGVALPDTGDAFCGECGQALDEADNAAPASLREVPGPGTGERNTTREDTWEQTKSGFGAVYAILICGIGLVVVGVGIWGLILGFGNNGSVATHAPPVAERETISGFETTAKTESFQPGVNQGTTRVLAIKYTGTQKLGNVEITLALHFVSREKETERYQFKSWEPGETQYLRSTSKVGRAVHYSWSGTAFINDKEVKLAGGEGSHE
jgi:hypothetical protein